MSEVTQDEVDAVLQDVAALHDRTGTQTLDSVTETAPDGTRVNALVALHGNIQFTVQASTEWPHCIIKSRFDAAEALAAGRAQALTDGGHQQSPQLSGADVSQAKQDLRGLADDDLDVIRRELVKSISRGPHGISLNTEDDLVTGFSVERRLYLYDRDISVQEYAEIVQELAAVLYRGKEQLLQRYDIQSAVDGPSSPGPRGFQ